MDINFDFKKGIDKNRDSNFEQDSEDILREISQIAHSEDKSFDSPVVFTKNKAIFNDYNIDIDQLAKDNDISTFSSNFEKYNKKNKNKTLDYHNNMLINNKQLLLNQKLKYLCSLLQTLNINIMKYGDLKQFNKYLEDKTSFTNIFEPINILFDIIHELIVVIQKELRNNNILMKELKRLRYNRSINEREIYKLKMNIRVKDKELKQLKVLKKDEYYKYNENEMNELKNENKELYKKINTYKQQMKRVEENNNEMKYKLQSFNTDRTTLKNNNGPINLVKYNSNYNFPNLLSITDINSNNKGMNDTVCSLKKKTSFFSEIKNVNNKRNYSASKVMSFKSISQNYNYLNDSYYNSNNNINNSNKKKFSNGRSIIANLMFLLKEINELLNAYNSSISSIKFNKFNTIEIDSKNEDEKNNINIINNDFINKLTNLVNNMKDYMKEENKNTLNQSKDQVNNRKILIHVNTSKWKFRKKSHKNNVQKNEESENSSLNLSSSNKKNIINQTKFKLLDNNINEEDCIKKIVKHNTHNNILPYINTDSLKKN